MHGAFPVKDTNPTAPSKAARRRRKRSGQKVHDRRANVAESDDLRTIVVDDPYEAGGKITVIASLRDDPLGRMHARHQIDEAQYSAGRAYQRLCEMAEIVAIKAMDPTKEPVDGGGVIFDPVTDRQIKAAKKLAALSRILGLEGEAICRAVLCRGIPVERLAIVFGTAGAHEARYLGRRFRGILESLAVELDFAPRPHARLA